jgi:GxxExxY protein
MTENELAQKVFAAGLRVHKEIGPGLLEKVYEECLFYELVQQKLSVERQKPLSIKYRNV